MSTGEIARRRMVAQRLWGPTSARPEQVVGWLGAAQSQELALAKWSLAQRTAGVTKQRIDRALRDGRILRTHILRPTWHFVLPADIRWMLRLTGPRIAARMDAYEGRLELTPKLLSRACTIIAKAVADGHKTRAELSEWLARAKIDVKGQRLAHVVIRAEIEAIVCSGAPAGSHQTYASLDERAPRAKDLSRDAALAELASRYFTSHGPATVRDFVWWSSLTTADARAAVDAAGLNEETHDGRTYYAAERPQTGTGRGAVDVVQCYDEVVVGYTHTRDVLLKERGARPYDGRGLLHPILVDGRLAGFWKHSAAGPRVLEFATSGRRALDAALERMREFFGSATAPAKREGRGR